MHQKQHVEGIIIYAVEAYKQYFTWLSMIKNASTGYLAI